MPYIILTPFTFVELSILFTYCVVNFASAPLTIISSIRFSMTCAVSFLMLKMYVQICLNFFVNGLNGLKVLFSTKLCSSLDYISANIENRFLDREIPINDP